MRLVRWKNDLSGLENTGLPTITVSQSPETTVDDTSAMTAISKSSLVSNQRIVTLGYAAPGDGGANEYYWDASSTATADNFIYFASDEGGAGRFISKETDGLTTRQAGAVGVGDHTAAIQRLFTHLSDNDLSGRFIKNDVYNVTDNLYIWGGASVTGSATMQLTADPTYPYFMICGTSSYGGAADSCTGVFRDFKIDIQSPSTQEIGLYVGSADGLEVLDVEVATNGKCSNKGIGMIPNANYIVGSSRDNIKVQGCDITGSGSGDGETIGGELCNNLRVMDCNVIKGRAYDDLGFHKCSRLTVSGNYMKSYDGRIYVSDSQIVKIHGNTIDYDSTSQGMGIYVGSESTAIPNVCDDVDISGNTVWYRSTITGFGYGIRCEAGRNVRIRGNRLINDSAQNAAGLYVENQTLSGWVDPTGRDPNDNPQSHSVKIIGNICDGPLRVTGGDQVTIRDNEADNLQVESPASLVGFCGNTATSGTITDNQFDSTSRDAAKLLFTRVVPNTGASYVKGTEFHSGIGSTLYNCQRAVAVTHFIVSSTTARSTGFYQIRLLLNGTQTGSTKTFSGSDKTQVSFIASAGTKDYIADVGDTLEVEAKTNNGTPTPNDVVIEVYGFELT